jgi:hypothetical protein
MFTAVKGQVGNTTVLGDPLAGRIMLRETPTDVGLYVHPASIQGGRLPINDMAEEICNYCDVRDEKMRRLIANVLREEDQHVIEDSLLKEEVGGYDENDLEAVLMNTTYQNPAPSSSHVEEPTSSSEHRIAAQNSTKTTSKQTPSRDATLSTGPAVLGEVVNQSKPSTILYQGYSSSGPVPDMNAREIRQAIRHAETGTAIRINGRENVPSQTYPSAEGTYPTKKVNLNKQLKPSIRPARNSSPHKPTYENPMVSTTPRDQSREETIGVIGELAVFNILKDIFGPAIDDSAWTSELRGHVEGFTAWTPAHPTRQYSDFTVRDPSSTLTTWMLANAVDFPDQWIVETDMLFHIEVKTTARECAGEPFIMSHLQMDKARLLAGTGSGAGPTEVFVIFRVYDAESAVPGLKVHCALWDMIQSGGWKREAQEWKVSPASA